MNLSNRLHQFFLILFVGISAYITYFTFQTFERASFFHSIFPQYLLIILLILGVVLSVFLIHTLLLLTEKIPKEHQKFLCPAVLPFVFLMQLAVIFLLKQSTFMYDPYRVFDKALQMLSDPAIHASDLDGYFGIYPNNIPFTILCYWLLKIGSLFQLSEYGLMLFLQIINALFMDLAVFLTYQLLYRFISVKAARCFIIVCLFQPLLILWPGFFYTSTMVMPFLMGSLLLFLEILHTSSMKKRCLYGGLLGILLLIGFKIRATIIVTIIAFILYWFVTSLGHLKDAVKKQFPAFLTVALSFLLSAFLWNQIQTSYASFDTTDTAFPVVSWLAMGLKDDGMFNTADYYDTLNASTAEEKKELNTEKFKERLRTLGVKGYLDLAGRKMRVTWCDGTDDYLSYLDQYDSSSKLHTFLFGAKKDFLVFYMQICRCFLFLFTTIGAVFLFCSKKSVTPVFLLQLNLIGGTFFHILWETGELYSLCFSFLLIALACVSFSELQEINVLQKDSHLRYIPSGIAVAAILCILGICFSYSDSFCAIPVKKHAAVIQQKTYTSPFVPGLTKGEQISQTFYSDQPFNRIAVRAKCVNADMRSSQYQIDLFDADNQCLLHMAVSASDLLDYDYFYCGLPEMEFPEGEEQYTLCITGIEGTKEDSIAFLAYETGNHDAYPKGIFLKDGVEQVKKDLNFMVYASYEDLYFQPKVWKLFLGMILLGAVGIAAGITVFKKKG